MFPVNAPVEVLFAYVLDVLPLVVVHPFAVYDVYFLFVIALGAALEASPCLNVNV